MHSHHTASAILMIRPAAFGFNEQTADSNAFQNNPENNTSIQKSAVKEFDQMVNLLQQHRVNVVILNDTEIPQKPDAVFPNNWVTFHENGDVLLYPMQAVNRRMERREDIITRLEDQFHIAHIIDLSRFELQEQFLEGTGSMVLDRENKIAYACISPRTNSEVLQEFCNYTGYQAITFNASDESGQSIYHTNVLMCAGKRFVVLCAESITSQEERKKVLQSITDTGKEIIEITFRQLRHFAGNMLEVTNVDGENLLVMSLQAFKSLNEVQLEALQKYAKLVTPDLQIIETTGGGSARCMMAEIYLPPVNKT